MLAAVAILAFVAASRGDAPISAQSPTPDEQGTLVANVRTAHRWTWQLALESTAVDASTDNGTMRRRRIVPRSGPQRGQRAGADFAQAVADDVSAPAAFLQNYTGATFGELGSLPPDPSGAAGPSQFILAANGRIRSFSKATGLPDGVLNVTTNSFFGPVRAGASTFTPTIKYDRLAGRWFIVMATDAIPGRIVIASSNAAAITATTIWSFFSFDNNYSGNGCAVDSPTFGLDPFALYIGVLQFCDNGVNYAGTSGFVVRKTSVIDASTPVVTAFHNLTGTATGPGPYAPMGVDNEELTGIGYFIGVDYASFGTLMLRRVTNPGVTPTISANVPISVSPTAPPIPVRHLGNLGGVNGYLDGGDDRLTSASVRNGRLWTAHAIGVVDNGQASGSATRNAVRWYEIGSLTSGTPTVMQSGTLYTAGGGGSVDQRNYFVPSIATSSRGRTLIGFTAAGTSEFANAGVAERYSSDGSGALRAAQVYTSASAAYNPPGDPGTPPRGRRWGGASSTVEDGCDGSTIWTVQQFTDATNSYALRVARSVGPAPATPASVTPNVIANGLPSVNLQVTGTAAGGTGFFDPGAGYLCHLGASIPGVVVNSVTYNSPTSATVNVSTVNAAPGLKAITIINPDGQAAASGSILRVTPGAMTVIDTPLPGAVGQPVTVTGWSVDGAAASGTGVDTVHVYAYPAAGNPTFLGVATYGLSRSDIGAAHGSRFTASGFSLTTSTVLTPGPYTIVAYGHSILAGTFNSSATVAVTFMQPAPPFGIVDTPNDNITVSGEVGITGWALDDAGVTSVDIFRSPVASEGTGQIFVGRAVFIRGSRTDVQQSFPNLPGSDNAGWGFMMLTNTMPNQGNGTFDFFIYATDNAGLTTLLGRRRLNVANSQSTMPFGTIDTPGQGETVSGTIVNFGWALAKPGRMIPIDGSTITVLVDNIPRGHPVYNNPRADIAALFPGLANTNGAIGYFMLDTTTLSNGLHTISWVITDNTGQTSGVGSRFFRVQNGS